MSSIPEELYKEILVRVPSVKSLLICKCVCKNWRDLISSSGFVKSHLHFTTQRNNPILMLEGGLEVLKSIAYDSLESSSSSSSVCGIEDAAVEIEYPLKYIFKEEHVVDLVGSCNGLVCVMLVRRIGGRMSLCLWNPATREYKELPKLPSYLLSVCALSYDHKNEDYKFAIGEALGMSDTQIHIYSLALNSWKPVKTVPYWFASPRAGVLANGNLHWLAVGRSVVVLLSFDSGDESFKELPLPIELSGIRKWMLIGVLERCLCILEDANVFPCQFDVWNMLDYGVQGSWTRCYRIIRDNIMKQPECEVTPIWTLKNGKSLFMSYGSLVLYDLKHGSAIKLNNDNNGTRLAINYFESLVSLNSGTYVGR